MMVFLLSDKKKKRRQERTSMEMNKRTIDALGRKNEPAAIYWVWIVGSGFMFFAFFLLHFETAIALVQGYMDLVFFFSPLILFFLAMI